MAGGLAALLDDVAAIAKMAASNIDDVAGAAGKTSMKAAGVVVDDAAVTPRFVAGVTPARELPMIWKITKGSLFNKLIIILPLALVLSWLAPWALTPILMVGGSYLCFEGAEKVWDKLLGHKASEEEPAGVSGGDAEKRLVKSAITTDLILSAEIMIISLNEVADQPMLMRTGTLIVVAFIITLAVYGAVAVLVKMDDVGLHFAQSEERSPVVRKMGRMLVNGMPKVLAIIALIGTAAMLWVGGHIVVSGLNDFGVHLPYQWAHHLADIARNSLGSLAQSGWGASVAWLTDTAFSALFGLLWGSLIFAVVSPFHRRKH
ncbi:DUF808 domain-containing protein [Corynebacterium spheniscorum]|uniref:Inner membrane protein YedI n=1 Tax=Corynebacterium spheniscorum TaxID=185761 RepID=A0A1I2RV77_9CORY|nr:DUF808 domain-containing protein [Corynebacterium spheniscorum]KAA8720986.1 DUF808 domain-containing protein [Corynebacterium spheniscorum]SFG44390.1 hypothetical protein SAMN05660282_00912 [Corynebacterium spheniscorum]